MLNPLFHSLFQKRHDVTDASSAQEKKSQPRFMQIWQDEVSWKMVGEWDQLDTAILTIITIIITISNNHNSHLQLLLAIMY